MPSNFQDVVVLNDSTLSVLGDQIALGAAAGSKSIVFAQDPAGASALHLVASNPTAARTVVLRDADGTLGLVTAISAGTTRATGGEIVFSNSNGVTFGLNGNTVTASYTPGAGGAVNFSAGTTSGDLASVVFSNSNRVSFGLNGSTITAQHALNFSAGTTSQNVSDQIIFSNANSHSFGLNGSTITASYQAPIASYFRLIPPGAASSAAITVSAGSIQLIQLPYPLSFTRVDVPMLFSMASAATSNTAAMAVTSAAIIYSRDGSTLNPIVGSIGNTTYSWASNTANYASVTGGRLVSWGLATLLQPGYYYVYAAMSTAGSSVGAATTNLGATVSAIYGSTYTASAFADFGQASNQTHGFNQFVGVISSVVTNTTQTLQISQVTVTGTRGARANLPVRLWRT